MMDFREQRVLHLAIAASLLLHAIALFLSPGVRAPQRAPLLPTLTAVLRAAPQDREPESVVAETRKPEPPQPVVAPPPKQVTAQPPTPARTPTPQPMTAPSAQPAPSIPAVAPSTSTSDAKSGPSTSATPSPPATVASAAPGASAARADPADPTALQSYKVQLAAFAVKYKRYPRVAVERGWEGITEVRLSIGPDGKIREAVVAVSSGHEILDQQAIEMVRKAAPLTEITSGLRNREFSVNLPIVFNIERKGG